MTTPVVARGRTTEALVDFMRARRENGDSKPVVWLGAGCSVHDGVPAAAELMDRLVPRRPGEWGSQQYRFDRLLKRLPRPHREVLFHDSFEREPGPDSPYHHLVHLLDAGYVDVVFTFNIDRLIEQALRSAGRAPDRDYALINVRGTQVADAARRVTSTLPPRVRVVKLHGDYGLGINCMTSEEIAKFGRVAGGLVGEHSRQPALVCGYSFFHLDVLAAFSPGGEPVFYVNRAFPETPMVLSILERTHIDQPLVVDGDDGCFERFAPALCARLGACPWPVPAGADGES